MPEPKDFEPELRKLLAQPRSGLLWYHRLGRCLLRRQKACRYGESQMADLAERLGSRNWRDLLYRALGLAKAYTEAEVRGLVGKLSWSKMKILLLLDKAQRRNLQEQAVRNQWSVQRLRFEADKARSGQLSPSTDQPKATQTPEAYDLWQLAKRTRAWRQWLQATWPKDRFAKLRPGGAKLAGLASRADAALESLVEAIERRRQPGPPP
jgi:hypothetical protein